MNNSNKKIFDKMQEKAIIKIEESEKYSGYGILTILTKYQVIKGKLTKDFVCDVSFKETFKFED
jgi:hypothetical protein